MNPVPRRYDYIMTTTNWKSMKMLVIAIDYLMAHTLSSMVIQRRQLKP